MLVWLPWRRSEVRDVEGEVSEVKIEAKSEVSEVSEAESEVTREAKSEVIEATSEVSEWRWSKSEVTVK